MDSDFAVGHDGATPQGVWKYSTGLVIADANGATRNPDLRAGGN